MYGNRPKPEPNHGDPYYITQWECLNCDLRNRMGYKNCMLYVLLSFKFNFNAHAYCINF